MFDLRMASIALDLPIGDMPLMQEFRGKCNIAKVMIFMTFPTLVLGNMPIALVDPRMAIETVHPSVDVSFVVEVHSPDKNIPFWLDMT